MYSTRFISVSELVETRRYLFKNWRPDDMIYVCFFPPAKCVC